MHLKKIKQVEYFNVSIQNIVACVPSVFVIEKKRYVKSMR